MFHGGNEASAAWTAGVTLLCAIWWITEAIPIAATSLIPLAVLPMVGVLSPKQVGEAYGNELILLFLGGFMLSAGMERSGAHRRIALHMVRWFGASSHRRIVFGFMTASAALSMWISNTATILMLLPIVMAVLERNDHSRLAQSLLLGVAYAASIGGISTPIGTPPNLVFMQAYRAIAEQEPTFLEWMCWTLPITLIMLPCVGLWLTRRMSSSTPISIPEVGRWEAKEIRTLVVFAVTAVLWITRSEPLGGWSELLHLPHASDASVALLAVVAMFVIPNGAGEKLLDWESAVRIPWGLLILYGGGIAIADAFRSSGLSESVGHTFTHVMDLPPIYLIGVICLIVTFLTEITSNTATATLLMPILAAVASETGIEPRLIMIPATVSASFAFMLPVATPTNAVVFGSGRLTVSTMAREGFAINLFGVVVVTLICWWMFG